MAEARRKAGLSQADLADLSGIARVTIGRIECGSHTGYISTIEILADTLGISIDEYIGHEVVRREDDKCIEEKSISQTAE